MALGRLLILVVVVAVLCSGAAGARSAVEARWAAIGEQQAAPALEDDEWDALDWQGVAEGAAGGGGSAHGAGLGATSGAAHAALLAVAGRHDILVWMMRLNSSECTSPAAAPCYNIYTINSTSGDLLWFAYSTDITGIKGAALGRRALYFTTWAGPGLYSVSLASGRVRWEFPPNNWFAYWRKEIDLPPSASFDDAAESGGGGVFATAVGPPARVYGLRAKRGGEQQWEWRADRPLARLADIAGPDAAPGRAAAAPARGAPLLWAGGEEQQLQGAPAAGGEAGGGAGVGGAAAAGVLYLALAAPGGNASWLQALSLSDGAPLWASEPQAGVEFNRVELDGPRLLVTNAAATLLVAYEKGTGRLLWRREGAYCAEPSPVARVHAPDAPRWAGGALSGGGGGEEVGGGGGSGMRSLLGDGDGGGGGALGSGGVTRGHGVSGGVLLLARDCGSLQGLTALDTGTGKTLWSGLDTPHAAKADGGCSWVEVAGGAAYLGCNCPGGEGPAGRGGAPRLPVQRQQQKLQRRRRLSEEQPPPLPALGGAPGLRRPEPPAAANESTVCLFAVELVTGRRAWWSEVGLGGAAAFDALSQPWGQAPVALALGGKGPGVVAFFTNTTVVGASAADGRVLWRAPLPAGEWFAPWQLPAQMPAPPGGRGGAGGCGGGGAPLLLAHSLRGAGGNKTSVYAFDAASGCVAWARAFNGSMQEPADRSDGGAALLPLGPRVVSEACRRGRCCLRALNASSGKPAWAMCLDAARGTDPTNPRAQFAIWVVTLVTIASIAALILGAALLYVNRWADERSLLAGGGGHGSDYGTSPSGGAARRGRGGAAAAAAAGGGGGSSSGSDAGGDSGGGAPPRASLFARSGGAAAAVLGGPPSPGSIAAAAAAEAAAAEGSGRGGRGGRGGLAGMLGRPLFGGRERVPPRAGQGQRPPPDAPRNGGGGGGPQQAQGAGGALYPNRPRVG
ncbi:MAG: hypothetical protein J3K34DRAFT_521604 [Monoraphidium minutum]|nr:MAG: hypothetical protein J3K34DRAFT_521604 [Monoraphidium minutum]